MSALTIAPNFPLRRIKIINQHVLPDASKVRIHAQPDKRFQLLCHFYSQKVSAVHS
jgi:hypothetical protein